MGKRDEATARIGETGVTLVEMMVSTVLFVGVMVLTYSTVVVVDSVTRQSEAETRQEESFRLALARLRGELRYATTENDPRTNQPRFEIRKDARGRDVLRYHRLAGARLVAGEMQPIWSGPIEISLDDEGRVLRTEGRRRRVLGTGVKDLHFEVTASGRFRVTCVTTVRDPRTGKRRDVTHRLVVKPRR